MSQVLATDGVWEVMTAQEVVHFVQRWRKRPWQGWNASDALTLEAQERWKLLQAEVGRLSLWRRALCCPVFPDGHPSASVLTWHAPINAEGTGALHAAAAGGRAHPTDTCIAMRVWHTITWILGTTRGRQRARRL